MTCRVKPDEISVYENKLEIDFDAFCDKPSDLDLDMDTLSNNLACKSACVTFDGKKVKQGSTENSVDVDLLGFENGTTLEDRRKKLEEEPNTIQYHSVMNREKHLMSHRSSYQMYLLFQNQMENIDQFLILNFF